VLPQFYRTLRVATLPLEKVGLAGVVRLLLKATSNRQEAEFGELAGSVARGATQSRKLSSGLIFFMLLGMDLARGLAVPAQSLAD
jgi:hypothetical protein